MRNLLTVVIALALALTAPALGHVASPRMIHKRVTFSFNLGEPSASSILPSSTTIPQPDGCSLPSAALPPVSSLDPSSSIVPSPVSSFHPSSSIVLAPVSSFHPPISSLPPVQPAPVQSKVQICSFANFGSCISLPVFPGTRSQCINLNGGLSGMNQGVSSIRVPSGFTCTFHDNFSCFDFHRDRAAITLPAGDFPDLRKFNFDDRASSFSCSSAR